MHLVSPPLPEGLPVPQDDGACAHLVGMPLPEIPLATASGATLVPSRLAGLTVIYAYPISGADDSILPDGWDAIPGARGCTPQSCSFRDHAAELARHGAAVYGLATQTPAYLAGEVARIHLPFDLISDADLALQRALRLPVFDIRVAGTVVLKRATLICEDAVIRHVFYPVFPPDRAADQVLGWLEARARGHTRSEQACQHPTNMQP